MTHPSAIAELLVHTVPQIVRLLYFFQYISQNQSILVNFDTYDS